MEETWEEGMDSRAAKRQKPCRYEQGDDVEVMLMQQMAQEMWDWPQDEGFTNEYVHHVHPCIDSGFVAFNRDMAESPAVVEPRSSMLVSLVVDKDGFTTLVRPDHHSRMQLKIGLANSLGVGHIVPPVSVVHGFIFVHNQSKELQLSMFDVSCLRGKELCTQKRRDRNRVLHEIVKEAWHTHQIAAVHRRCSKPKTSQCDLSEMTLQGYATSFSTIIACSKTLHCAEQVACLHCPVHSGRTSQKCNTCGFQASCRSTSIGSKS